MSDERLRLAVAFTDLVDSKRVFGALPQYLADEFLRAHSSSALRAAHGSTLHSRLPAPPTNLGDGNLFLFSEPDEALIFALCLDASWRTYRREAILPCLENADTDALKLRIGLHYGLIYHDEFSAFATQTNLSRAINTAFVLKDLAAPGEAAAGETLINLVESRCFITSYGGRFDPLARREAVGEEERLSWYRLKGVSRPPAVGHLVGLPRERRRRVARDWFWYALYRGNETAGILEAVEGYRKALELAPELKRAWRNLGALLYRIGDLDAAASALERAVELDPADALAWANLGGVLQARGRSSPAQSACRRALALDEANELAHYNLGNVLFDDEDYAAAAEHYRRCLELNPVFAKAHYNLACLAALRGDVDEAFAELERAIALEPKLAQRIDEDEDLAALRDDERFDGLGLEP